MTVAVARSVLCGAARSTSASGTTSPCELDIRAKRGDEVVGYDVIRPQFYFRTILAALGADLSNVYTLEGGMRAWNAAYPNAVVTE